MTNQSLDGGRVMGKLTRHEKLRKERRLGIVPVDIEFMAQHLITPKQGVKVQGLPIDAIFITAFYSPESYGLNMVYGHESFDKVGEGVNLPILNVVYTEVYAVGNGSLTDSQANTEPVVRKPRESLGVKDE